MNKYPVAIIIVQKYNLGKLTKECANSLLNFAFSVINTKSYQDYFTHGKNDHYAFHFNFAFKITKRYTNLKIGYSFWSNYKLNLIFKSIHA